VLTAALPVAGAGVLAVAVVAPADAQGMATGDVRRAPWYLSDVAGRELTVLVWTDEGFECGRIDHLHLYETRETVTLAADVRMPGACERWEGWGLARCLRFRLAAPLGTRLLVHARESARTPARVDAVSLPPRRIQAAGSCGAPEGMRVQTTPVLPFAGRVRLAGFPNPA
jgi:hypothetical protein